MRYKFDRIILAGRWQIILAMTSSLLLVALLASMNDGKAGSMGPLLTKDRQLIEQGTAPCTAAYQPGAVLFSRETAQKLLSSPQDLRPYIRSISNKRFWGLADNLALKKSERPEAPYILELKIPKGAINPGNKLAPRGGAGFHWTPEMPIETKSACLSYAVWFPKDFDFVKGGKLPGLFGGTGPSGGKKVTGKNGFSTRFMWRTDGQGEVYAYIIGNNKRGISIDRGAFAFERGSWTTVVQEVILNTPGIEDGMVRAWVNGKLVIARSQLSYRSTPDINITGVMAHVFFGGKDPSWASTKDTIVRYSPFDLRWQKVSQSEAAPQTAPQAAAR